MRQRDPPWLLSRLRRVALARHAGAVGRVEARELLLHGVALLRPPPVVTHRRAGPCADRRSREWIAGDDSHAGADESAARRAAACVGLRLVRCSDRLRIDPGLLRRPILARLIILRLLLCALAF